MTTPSPLARISLQIVVSSLSSPPGFSPKLISSRHRAGDPALVGDPRHRGKAHAGGAAHDLEDRRHRVDSRHRGEVALEVVRHAIPFAFRGLLGARLWRVTRLNEEA